MCDGGWPPNSAQEVRDSVNSRPLLTHTYASVCRLLCFSEGGVAVEMDKTLRQCLREFPYHHSVLLKQIVKTLAKVEPVSMSTPPHTASHSHTHKHTAPHSHTQTHSSTPSHTHTQLHTLTHRHTAPHPHTHKHTAPHSHTQTHSSTPSHTHTHRVDLQMLCPSLCQP